MCKKIRYIHLVILSAFMTLSITAQDKAPKEKDVVRTATDLKSGNTQDVLTNFFQVALEDIKNGKQFRFSSSLIAFRARTKPSILVDTNYLKKAFARNFNFSLDVGANDNNRFSHATIGIKYAIINRRDKSIFNAAYEFYGQQKVTDYDEAYRTIQIQVDEEFLDVQWRKDNDIELTKEDSAKVVDFFSFKSETDFSQLPVNFKVYLAEVLAQNKVYKGVSAKRFQNFRREIYDSLAAIHNKKPILTIGALYVFDPKLAIQAEYLQGLFPASAPFDLEVDLTASYEITDTTFNFQRQNRQEWSASGGLNWIYRIGGTPAIELKGFAEYSKILLGSGPDESPEEFTVNAVLRFRITSNLWLPVSYKYTPAKGSELLTFAIKANF